MKIGITYRLFLAILVAAGLAVISMVVIMRWSIDRGFLRYVNSLEQTRLALLAERLEEGYARQESWVFLKNEPGQWRRLLSASLSEEGGGYPDRERPEGRGAPSQHEGGAYPPKQQLRRGFAMRVFLLDAENKLVSGPGGIPNNVEVRPLRHRDRIVGYLGLLPRRHLSDERQLRFVKEQSLALGIVAVMVVLVAAGLSLPLANRLIRPIRALAAATHDLAAGRYDIRVPMVSADELGLLARDFNSLALVLEKNEQARRRWVADVSHELRTPLAVRGGSARGRHPRPHPGDDPFYPMGRRCG